MKRSGKNSENLVLSKYNENKNYESEESKREMNLVRKGSSSRDKT
jgi:hypothetical protein